MNFESLKKIADIIYQGEYENDDGLYIIFEKAYNLCYDGWCVKLGGYDRGYEVSYRGEWICNLNYETENYEFAQYVDEPKQEEIFDCFGKFN